MQYPFATSMIVRLARTMGIMVHLEPEYGYAGRLVFPDGRTSAFLGASLDVNPLGAAALVRDKAHTLHFLAALGYRVPVSKAFLSNAWAGEMGSDRNESAALAYVYDFGFPLVVKPNSLSRGRRVSIVRDVESCARAIARAVEGDRVFLVEEFVRGQELRINVFDGAVALAHTRRPMTDITDTLPLAIADVAIRATRDLGLRWSGMDCVVHGDHVTILEINASPGMRRFASLGDREHARVEACYRSLLAALVQGPSRGSLCSVPGAAVPELHSVW